MIEKNQNSKEETKIQSEDPLQAGPHEIICRNEMFLWIV